WDENERPRAAKIRIISGTRGGQTPSRFRLPGAGAGPEETDQAEQPPEWEGAGSKVAGVLLWAGGQCRICRGPHAMAKSTGKVELFISHSAADERAANLLLEWLKANLERIVDLHAFCSSRIGDLDPGEPWYD